MKSYMTIDRIEGKFAICELEFISTEQSAEVDYWERDTEMIDVPTAMLKDPEQGDVFMVEHEKETLYLLFYVIGNFSNMLLIIKSNIFTIII